MSAEITVCRSCGQGMALPPGRVTERDCDRNASPRHRGQLIARRRHRRLRRSGSHSDNAVLVEQVVEAEPELRSPQALSFLDRVIKEEIRNIEWIDSAGRFHHRTLLSTVPPS